MMWITTRVKSVQVYLSCVCLFVCYTVKLFFSSFLMQTHLPSHTLRKCQMVRSGQTIILFDSHEGQGHRENLHDRYANLPIFIEKLSSRAFQRYMTTLYRHAIYRWKTLELSFSMVCPMQRYANASLHTCSRCNLCL